jgi:rhodanese-related sulfurtransferase
MRSGNRTCRALWHNDIDHRGGVSMKKKLLGLLSLIFAAFGLFTTFALSGDVPMMTKDELKAMLGNPGLVIFDVRLGSDYFASDIKIKGAERPEYGTKKIVPPEYSGKTIVIYSGSSNEVISTANAQILIEKGYTKVYVLKGGWEEWLKAEYPIQKK